MVEKEVITMDAIYQLIPYIDEHYDFIYNVKKNAYKEYVEKYWGEWNDNNQIIRFKKSMEENKNNIYIILYENEKIGFYQGKLVNEDTYYIENICIVTEYQRKGIGTKILSDIIEKYKDYNIEIQYFKNNPVGNLYKKLGFNIYDETEFHYKMKRTRGGN